jgi:hypothetical protein
MRSRITIVRVWFAFGLLVRYTNALAHAFYTFLLQLLAPPCLDLLLKNQGSASLSPPRQLLMQGLV